MESLTVRGGKPHAEGAGQPVDSRPARAAVSRANPATLHLAERMLSTVGIKPVQSVERVCAIRGSQLEP